MNNDKRIIFMGTASFSKIVLKRVIHAGYNVVGVISQPDRLVGRKKELHHPDAIEVAKEYNIDTFQPERIKKDYNWIIEKKPDLIITAAYGQIVPDEVLNAPSIACINVHASLLPRYRGGAPVHYAIMNGDHITGVTIMYMASKMDAGNIISQKETIIGEKECTGTLYDRLSYLGADLLIMSLPSILNQTNPSIVQDESLVSYAPIIKREDEKIDFNNSLKDVYNKVRGLNPWPGCYGKYEDKNIKIFEGVKEEKSIDSIPGTIVAINKDSISVACQDGVYNIIEMQIPGKKRLKTKDILLGNHIFEVGKKFD